MIPPLPWSNLSPPHTKWEYERVKSDKVASSRTQETSSTLKFCRRRDGGVHQTWNSCDPGEEITKAEFNRLKRGKTIAVVESKNSEPETSNQIKKSVLDVLDAPYVTLKNANVRERPDVESTRVTTLPKGSEVTALGKVKSSNWYLISRDGKKLGYVLGSLIGDAESVAEAVVQVPNAARNPDAVAVIIGNRNYGGSIPAVDFAFNDADAIKKFITERLGYDPENIIDLRDATRAKIEATFGNERTHQGKLWSYLDAKGGSDVVIYYSGHGVPGQNDGLSPAHRC